MGSERVAWPRPQAQTPYRILTRDLRRRHERLAHRAAAAARAVSWSGAGPHRQRARRDRVVDGEDAAREPGLLSAERDHGRAAPALLRTAFPGGRGRCHLLCAAVARERAALGRAHYARLRLRCEGL